MPRRPRITIPGIPLHLIQRGNNRQACFFANDDYRLHLNWLEKYAKDSCCLVHAYVLMTNHAHLPIPPKTASAASDLMKQLGQRFVQYINRTYRRSGTLWEGRFRSCLAQEEEYILACYRYIELNPVRANMVSHPAEYTWSSYRANAQGEQSIITPHSLYTTLAGNENARQNAYRELFHYELDPGLVDEIRTTTNGNYALGSSRFQKEGAAALGWRVTPGKSGRPKKRSAPESWDLFGN